LSPTTINPTQDTEDIWYSFKGSRWGNI